LFVHWRIGIELVRFLLLLILPGDCLLTLNPAIHLILENRRGHRPVFQHLIVEGLAEQALYNQRQAHPCYPEPDFCYKLS